MSPSPKWHLERFSRFLHSSPQKCPYTLQWATLHLKIPPSYGGSGPHLMHGSWAHPSPQPKWHLDQFSHVCRAHYCERPTDRQITLLDL